MIYLGQKLELNIKHFRDSNVLHIIILNEIRLLSFAVCKLRLILFCIHLILVFNNFLMHYGRIIKVFTITCIKLPTSRQNIFAGLIVGLT